ncbi:hypothetical protein niasHS_014907 [Heterodera schachtii]|uniref:TFIIS N-terminal domain-containing protein n=1 Tax=Heterodera schachtii TaxID=97005 RepID=A0ABD2INU3_HETSC
MNVNKEEERLEKKVTKWAIMLTSEDKIEHALRRLDHVEINLQLLSSTGVGKAVNALRKHHRWGERAAGLVSRWKEVAKAETARAAEEAQRQNENGDGDTTEEEDEREEEEGAKSQSGEGTDDDDEESRPNPLVLRIKKEPQEDASPTKHATTPNNSSSTAKLLSQSARQNEETEAKKRHHFDDDCETFEDEQPIDAFASQLAAADKVQKSLPKKPKKVLMPSAESIQNSLLDSLKNPSNFGPSIAQPQPNNQQISMPTDLNINMFKAPKEKKRVYAGRRKTTGDVQIVPSLFDICMRFLLNNIDAIDETGDIPFDVLRPIIEKANAEQLMRLEKKNSYLREDTNYLWKNHCKKEFGKELAKLREEFGSDEEEEEEDDETDEIAWRKRYKMFRFEREQRLIRLSSQIKSNSEVAQPQRQAMVTAPIAPRYVRKRQIQNGIRVPANQVPSAVELTRARRQIFETGNDADLRSMPAAIRSANSLGSRSSNGGISSSFSQAKKKPQRGPLMMKTLRMLKKQRR